MSCNPFVSLILLTLIFIHMHMSFNCTLALSAQMVGPGLFGGIQLRAVQPADCSWALASVIDTDPLDEEVEVAARGFQNTQQTFPSLLFWGDYSETCQSHFFPHLAALQPNISGSGYGLTNKILIFFNHRILLSLVGSFPYTYQYFVTHLSAAGLVLVGTKPKAVTHIKEGTNVARKRKMPVNVRLNCKK